MNALTQELVELLCLEKVQENKDLESIRNIFIDYFKNVHFLRDNKYIYNMILLILSSKKAFAL